MPLRKSVQTAVFALFMGLAAQGAEAGKAAKPKKGDKPPPPPPANIEDVHVEDAWMRAARKGENGYIFRTFKN